MTLVISKNGKLINPRDRGSRLVHKPGDSQLKLTGVIVGNFETNHARDNQFVLTIRSYVVLIGTGITFTMVILDLNTLSDIKP